MMADDQSLCQCVTDLSNTNLQRAAIAHEAGGEEPNGIFGVLRRNRGASRYTVSAPANRL
jgi:hypothetical protein